LCAPFFDVNFEKNTFFDFVLLYALFFDIVQDLQYLCKNGQVLPLPYAPPLPHATSAFAPNTNFIGEKANL